MSYKFVVSGPSGQIVFTSDKKAIDPLIEALSFATGLDKCAYTSQKVDNGPLNLKTAEPEDIEELLIGELVELDGVQFMVNCPGSERGRKIDPKNFWFYNYTRNVYVYETTHKDRTATHRSAKRILTAIQDGSYVITFPGGW